MWELHLRMLDGGYLSASKRQVIVNGSIDGKMSYFRPFHTGESPELDINFVQLNEAIKGLTAAIGRWIIASTDWKYRGDDERRPALEELRFAGIKAFHALEGGQPDVLRGWLAGATYLESRVKRHHIPWEFLYLGDADGEVDLKSFLGYQLVVGRPISGMLPSNPDAPASHSVERALDLYLPLVEELIVGVAEDDTLASALTNRERGIFTSKNVTIECLAKIYSLKEVYQIESFLEKSPYVTHFNCHAWPDDERHDDEKKRESALQVSAGYPIYKKNVGALPLCEESMIVLNCCFGHRLELGGGETLATAFARRGVAAVVASMERLVDDYATTWAHHFYERLFAGAAVGPALLGARRDVIDLTGNPACLAYGLFGSYSARLVRSSEGSIG